jgi:hypothetical protein
MVVFVMLQRGLKLQNLKLTNIKIGGNMSITLEMLKKIQDEINNNPDYAGKTDAEIVSILNKPKIGTKVVETYEEPPITRLFNAVATAPNVITETDIKNARVITFDTKEGDISVTPIEKEIL